MKSYDNFLKKNKIESTIQGPKKQWKKPKLDAYEQEQLVILAE